MRNKWVVLAASVVMQSILGGIYAWSTFVPALESNYNLSKGNLGLIFGLTITIFTAVMILAGHWLAKKGPRPTTLTGAALFTIGYLVASFSGGSYTLLLLGISVLGGTGIGLGYVVPLSVGMRWFPDQKGLVTGVAVAGFGGGAVFLVNVAQYFLNQGVDVLVLFRYIGLVAGSLLFVAALLVQDPPGTVRGKSKVTGLRTNVTKPQFLLLLFGIFAGTFAGLMVVGNLKPMGIDAGLELEDATLAISLFAVGNAAGRIFWGWAFDRLGYKSVPMSLLLNSMVLLLPLFPAAPWVFLLGAALIGFGFGSCFVVYASAITRYFGIEHFSTLYPLIFFFGYGIAASAGPWFGGYLKESTESYQIPIIVSAALVSVATLALTVGLKKFKQVAGLACL